MKMIGNNKSDFVTSVQRKFSMVENFLTGTAKNIEPFSFLIPHIVLTL